MTRITAPRRVVLLLAGLGGLFAGRAQPAEVPGLWGFALNGLPVTTERLAKLSRETGVTPQLINIFVQWPENPATDNFPAASLAAIRRAGAVPVVTWEPMYYRRSDGAETMIPAARLLAGAYDAYLDAFARRAAAEPGPVVIRFAHEMNLGRYHWGTDAQHYGPDSPELYRRMWRHVVARFRASGASQVQWAFAPNADSVPGPDQGAKWNTAAAYYPGDAWVDVLGMDGYNWGDTQTPARQGWQSHWRAFDDIFARLHQELTGLASRKPLVVFETASAPTGGDKADWLRNLQATAQTWRLRGVIWFQVNKEVDWRLQTGLEPAEYPQWPAAAPSAAVIVRQWPVR